MDNEFNQVINFPEISTKTIKVVIEEDRFGNIIIVPINKKYAEFYDFYIQVDWQIQDFLEEFPKARYGRKNEYGNYEINDGEIFIMETDRFLEYWEVYN